MSLRAPIIEILRARGQAVPMARGRACWPLTEQEADAIWAFLVKQHHALVDLTEGRDADVDAAEALVKVGRAAGLPEPEEPPDPRDARERADDAANLALARRYPTLARAMGGVTMTMRRTDAELLAFAALRITTQTADGCPVLKIALGTSRPTTDELRAAIAREMDAQDTAELDAAWAWFRSARYSLRMDAGHKFHCSRDTYEGPEHGYETRDRAVLAAYQASKVKA